MNNQGRDLDLWEEVIEKAVNAEAKASLQPLSKIREINFRYPKGNKLLAKKDKNNTNQENRDGDKNKAKSHNPLSANSQSQIQVSKKDKYYGSCQGSLLAIGVNATEMAKKDNDKAKNLSYFEFYTCKQNEHYINKCSKNPKNEWWSRQPPHQ